MLFTFSIFFQEATSKNIFCSFTWTKLDRHQRRPDTWKNIKISFLQVYDINGVHNCCHSCNAAATMSCALNRPIQIEYAWWDFWDRVRFLSSGWDRVKFLFQAAIAADVNFNLIYLYDSTEDINMKCWSLVFDVLHFFFLPSNYYKLFVIVETKNKKSCIRKSHAGAQLQATKGPHLWYVNLSFEVVPECVI